MVEVWGIVTQFTCGGCIVDIRITGACDDCWEDSPCFPLVEEWEIETTFPCSGHLVDRAPSLPVVDVW